MKNIVMKQHEYVAIVTIDHPPANAWNLSAMREFEKVIHNLKDSQDVRAVILTGAGDKCFSAGFDVKDKDNAQEISATGRALWRTIDRFPKPVVAAINGYAFGGGLELALSCHFRLMSDDPKALLGLTEINLGIIPGWGGTQRLMRVVGKSKALDLILFSRRVNAKEALKIGLVDRIVASDQLMNAAMALGTELAERPPVAVRCVLEAISTGIYEGLDEGLRKEAEGSATVRDTEDRHEGFQAFIEKRKPVFKGR